MKKQFLGWVIGFLMFGMVGMAEAVVLVPDYGDTGWQTYSTTFANGFTGTVGFVTSDVLDTFLSSWMLIDNLSHAGNPANTGFELGDTTGFTSNGAGFVTPGPVFAASGNEYDPTDAFMFALDGAGGVDTSSFTNFFGESGTQGSTLETAISVLTGGTFSFDWAFLAEDGSPYRDFSAVYFRDATGAIAFQEVLGQIDQAQAPVPEPSTILLLGFGLAGLAGIAGKKMKN